MAISFCSKDSFPILQKIVQYFTLFLTIIAGVLFILSMPKQDWVRDDFSMKMSNETFTKLKENTQTCIGGAAVTKIPDDVLKSLGLNALLNGTQSLGMPDGMPTGIPKMPDDVLKSLKKLKLLMNGTQTLGTQGGLPEGFPTGIPTIPDEVLKSGGDGTFGGFSPDLSKILNPSSIVFGMLDDLFIDVTISLSAHAGFKQTCFVASMKGIQSSVWKTMFPKFEWCFNNDVFLKPQKYDMDDCIYKILFGHFSDEAKALNNTRICMILAVLCLVLALLVLLTKLVKWHKESIYITTVLCFVSCICVIGALGLVHTNYHFEKDFKKMRNDITTDHFKCGSGTDGGAIPDCMAAFFLEMIQKVDLKETRGDSIILAGLGVGILLIVFMLNALELYFVKKEINEVQYKNVEEMKYQNVELA